MQKNCAKNEVKSSQSGSQSKNYKSRLQKYVKQQQKIPGLNTLTTEKILTLLVIDTLKETEHSQYNSTILNIFQESLWNYQISIQFLKKLSQKNQKIQSIMSCMLMVVDGYFQFNSKKVTVNYIRMPLVMQYQCFFMITSTDNYFILFEVGLHKELKLQKNNFEFDIIQKITFVDIFFYQKAQEFTDTLQQYQLQIQRDFYRTKFNYLVCSSSQLLQAKQKSYLFDLQNKEWPQCIFKLNVEILIQWIPLVFKSQSGNNLIVDPYTGKYLEQEFYHKQRQICQNEEIANQNKYQLKFLADFKSAGVIIDILQKAPEFKIKLSHQEREVVSTPSNALVIGRSGTGKTTSIVLRIFASETLIKVKSKSNGLKQLTILKDYQEKCVNVHSIFTTANRYLVKEVEKYYQKLEQQALEAITKHRESRTFDFDQSFISETYSEITNFEGDLLDFVSTENHQEIQQAPGNHNFNKREQQQGLETQLMEKAHFPAFFSTQQLLILLDKQMKHPFFSAQMIQQLRDKIKNKVGFIDCDGINLDRHFPETVNQQQYSSEQGSSSIQQQVVVPEVDFLIFYQQFWPTVAQRVKGNQDPMSLPSLIWTQIYSYIKGSQYSYIYPGRCLPFSLYKERVINYINEQEIDEIYYYFKRYEEWKIKQVYFDQLDIVNNLLCNIEKGTYKQFPIHYLYIDEVQDLPQALIELFCKITEQGVMFSGDTAQCILKGVGFRFQDLQTLFKNSKKIGANELEKFQVFQLTTNFRSHNSILQLANCIITMLELLFPQTIDHLKKEVSNLKGPKPIFFKNPGYQQIFHYLNNYFYAEDICEIEFGYNQVVIVKNLEAKQRLPRQFDDALVLTVFQAKGLEFDDVIIYNCFTSDPIPQRQWELLTCIDVKETFIDSAIFQQSITKHQNNNQEENDYQINKDGQVRIPKLLLNHRYEKKQTNDYSSLCNELKALYVCVTRAKKRVLIYDDEPEKRCHLENILKLSDVCDFYPLCQQQQQKDQFENERLQQQNQIRKNQQDTQIQPIINQRQITEEDMQMWEQQGQLMFQRKVYDEAAKCFKKSKNQKMLLLSKAYFAAGKGSQILAQFTTYQLQYERFKQYDMKKKMDELQPQFQDNFKQAAELFLNPDVNDEFQAAQCFYSGQFYLESLKIFLNQNLFPQAAKSAKRFQQWLLAAIIHFKLQNLEKCLKLLHESGVDRFFEYEVLKQGYEFNILSEELIINYLTSQERLPDNIFIQLEKKSKSSPNQIDQVSYAQSVCPPISDEVQILQIFYEEIQFILSAQIVINDDLLDMVFEQIKVFWKCYFKILDKNSIMNRHNYSNLEKLFEKTTPVKSLQSQETLDFIIDVLGQLNQFSLLQILFPDQTFYDKNLKTPQNIIPPKIFGLYKSKIMELLNDDLQIFYGLFYNQEHADFKSLFQISSKQKQSNEFNFEREEIHQILCGPIENINQPILAIQCNQLFAHFTRLCEATIGNVEITQKKYLTGIFNQFKQSKALAKALIPSKSIDQYLKDKKVDFSANSNEICWNFYKVLMKELFSGDLIQQIISIQEDIFHKKVSPSQEKLKQILEIPDLEVRYPVIFNFLNTCCQYKEMFKRLLSQATLVQIITLYRILLKGSQIFQVENDSSEYKRIFKSICPFYQIYMPKAKILQNLSHSFVIMNKECPLVTQLNSQNQIKISENLIIMESESVFQLIRVEFSKRIERCNLIKWVFRYVLSQNRFQKPELHQFLCEPTNYGITKVFCSLLHRNLNQIFKNSQIQKLDPLKLKTTYQIITIFQSFILAISPQFINKIQSFHHNFKYYLSFQVNWKNQLSVDSLFDWLNYYESHNHQIELQYPNLLMHELNFVILILILTLKYQNSCEQSDKLVNYQILDIFDQITNLEALVISNTKQGETNIPIQNIQEDNNSIKDDVKTQVAAFAQDDETIIQHQSNNSESIQIQQEKTNINFDQDEKNQNEQINEVKTENSQKTKSDLISDEYEYQTYNFQEEEIYISKDMIEIIKFHHTFYQNIILDTKIDNIDLFYLIQKTIQQLINFVLHVSSDDKLSLYFRKIISLIYLLSYNCKACNNSKKNKPSLITIIAEELQNGIKQISSMKKQNRHSIFICQILEKLINFLNSQQFAPQKFQLYQFSIVINNPDQTMKIEKMDQINYLLHFNNFKEYQKIDSYQLLRISFLSDFPEIQNTKDIGYKTINSLKKLLNYFIQLNFLTYSQRNDFIILLTKICSLEQQLDAKISPNQLSGINYDITQIKEAILEWTQNKCKKEHQQFLLSYQGLIRDLK